MPLQLPQLKGRLPLSLRLLGVRHHIRSLLRLHTRDCIGCRPLRLRTRNRIARRLLRFHKPNGAIKNARKFTRCSRNWIATFTR